MSGIGPRKTYSSFDGLRGYAAIGILLMHYLINMNPGVIEALKASQPWVYGQLIPFFTKLVFLFFVLSAFSLCCGYFARFSPRTMENGRRGSDFDAETFYRRRYARIWPFFALLVVVEAVVTHSLEGGYEAFADLTLAFNFLPNPYISVIGIGWFVGLIFVFYMIFPWFVFLLQSRRRAWLAMGASVILHIILVRYFLTDTFCVASQIATARNNIVFSFPFFMAGGLLYLYRDYFLLRQAWMRGLLLVAACGATLLQTSPWRPIILGEETWWVLVVVVLWVAYGISGGLAWKGFKVLDNPVARFLGGISMEFYLCHMMVLRVIEKFHPDRFIHNPHALYWTCCVLGGAVSIVFSYVVAKIAFPALGRLWAGKGMKRADG